MFEFAPLCGRLPPFLLTAGGIGCRKGDKKATKRAMDILQEQSIRPTRNPLHKAPVGHTNGLGLYALIWPEVLHQLEAGLVKKAIACLVVCIQKIGTGKCCRRRAGSCS